MTYNVAKQANSADSTFAAQCWRCGYLYLTPDGALPLEFTCMGELLLPGLFQIHEFHFAALVFDPQNRHCHG